MLPLSYFLNGQDLDLGALTTTFLITSGKKYRACEFSHSGRPEMTAYPKPRSPTQLYICAALKENTNFCKRVEEKAWL